MNVFFVIASVAAVVFMIITSLILLQIYKIVRSVRHIVTKIEAGSDTLADDVAQFRTFIVRGNIVSKLISFVMSGGTSRRSRSSDDK